VQRVALLFHPKIEEAKRLTSKLASALAEQGVAVRTQSSWAMDALRDKIAQFDMLITLGGDGTILRAARASVPHAIPILGIDFGKLGFLAELDPEEALGALPNLLAGDYWLEKRPLLHIEHFRGYELLATYFAVNDAVIARGELARVLEVHVAVDGASVTTYLADGLIISTPTGSTAYALAVGGLILAPDVPAMMAIPIAPHLNVVRGLIVHADTEMEIMAHTHHGAILSVDGQIDVRWGNDDRLLVTTGAENCQLVRMRPRNYFFATLAPKLGEGPGAHHRFRTRKSSP